MHSMGKTLAELHAMLKLHEKGILNKAKNRVGYMGGKDPEGQEETARGKGESRKLKHRALSLYIRNGMRAAVEAIRSFNLILPSGLIIVLTTAHETAARILDMVPTKKVDRKPYEIWHGKAPKLSYLRVWGCEALETTGYYFYYPLKNKIFVSRNAKFFENSFMIQEASGSHRLLEMSRSDKGLEFIQEEDTQPFENTSKAHNEVAPIEAKPQNVGVHILKSTRIPQVPDRYGYYVDIEEYELGDLDELPNYKAAFADPESDKWLEAMNTEMQSIRDNQVWYLVDLLYNGRTV
ncbi:hypothetical protein Tco_0653653 [Tanacetum coccineum]|uniref:Zinc finger, CCHC-type n=1 Tax=Tanacetum coccineum TaxID=301880 RepID=A0ABQ4X162_9ASTR